LPAAVPEGPYIEKVEAKVKVLGPVVALKRIDSEHESHVSQEPGLELALRE
jgi:hypothetical protein